MEIEILPAVDKFLQGNQHLTPIMEFPASPGNQTLLVRDAIRDEWGQPIHYVLIYDCKKFFLQNTNHYFSKLSIPEPVLKEGSK